MQPLSFGLAKTADAEQIARLINSAYRGASSRLGWTTEADLLDGRRTDADEVLAWLANENAAICLCKAKRQLAGTLLLIHSHPQVGISMFAVDPVQQNTGIGKYLLQHAEQTAIQRWDVKRATMAVISRRVELIAFYQRRGYLPSGRSLPFPLNPEL